MSRSAFWVCTKIYRILPECFIDGNDLRRITEGLSFEDTPKVLENFFRDQSVKGIDPVIDERNLTMSCKSCSCPGIQDPESDDNIRFKLTDLPFDLLPVSDEKCRIFKDRKSEGPGPDDLNGNIRENLVDILVHGSRA